MRFMAAVFLFLFGSVSFASYLSYIDQDGSRFQNEDINTILVRNHPRPALKIYANSIGCELETTSIEEALNIQAQLVASTKDQVWIQCFGKLENRMIYTRKFSLGVMKSAE